MRNLLLTSLGAFIICGITTEICAQDPAAASGSSSWSSVDSIMGRTGAAQPGDVRKYSFPRSDLKVVVKGVQLKPALALGSWIAFERVGTKTAAMGDLVLTETELGPVMSALQKGGVEQTALHNHVLGESPRVMYMHVTAHGDAAAIARAVRAALRLTGTPLARPAAAATAPFDLDTAAVSTALGYRGSVNGGVYQVSVPRSEKIVDHDMEIPPSMGVATAINFQPTGSGRAAITGDFVMTADEVNPVIRALQAGHIQPTGLHSHMLGESPRLFFMHFWAIDDAVALARGLKAALAETKVVPAH